MHVCMCEAVLPQAAGYLTQGRHSLSCLQQGIVEVNVCVRMCECVCVCVSTNMAWQAGTPV